MMSLPWWEKLKPWTDKPQGLDTDGGGDQSTTPYGPDGEWDRGGPAKPAGMQRDKL